jgi:hypothetical protein
MYTLNTESIDSWGSAFFVVLDPYLYDLCVCAHVAGDQGSITGARFSNTTGASASLVLVEG